MAIDSYDLFDDLFSSDESFSSPAAGLDLGNTASPDSGHGSPSTIESSSSNSPVMNLL